MSEKYRLVLKDSKPNLVTEDLDIDDFIVKYDITAKGWFCITNLSTEKYIELSFEAYTTISDLKISLGNNLHPMDPSYEDDELELPKNVLEVEFKDFFDKDDKVISKEEAIKILGCSLKELDEVINKSSKFYKDLENEFENKLNDYQEDVFLVYKEVENPEYRDYEED